MSSLLSYPRFSQKKETPISGEKKAKEFRHVWRIKQIWKIDWWRRSDDVTFGNEFFASFRLRDKFLNCDTATRQLLLCFSLVAAHVEANIFLHHNCATKNMWKKSPRKKIVLLVLLQYSLHADTVSASPRTSERIHLVEDFPSCNRVERSEVNDTKFSNRLWKVLSYEEFKDLIYGCLQFIVIE